MSEEREAINRLLGIVLAGDASGLVTAAAAAEDALGKTERTADKASEKIQRAMKAMSMGAMVAGAGIVAGLGLNRVGGGIMNNFIQPAVDAASAFELEMKKVQFITGATGDEFAALREKAIDTGVETMFSPLEAAQALGALTQAGLGSVEAMSLLDQTLAVVAASANEIDLEQGAFIAGVTMKKFGLTLDETNQALDAMTKAANVSNLGFTDFAPFLNSLGSLPQELGSTVPEVFALGASLRNVGQLAAQSGQTVRGFGRTVKQILAVMEGASGPGGARKMKILNELGLTKEDFVDAQGNVRSLLDIAATLTDRLGKVPRESKRVALLQRLLGDQSAALAGAVNAFSDVSLVDAQGNVLKGAAALKAMQSQLEGATGEAQAGADAMLSSWEQIKKLFQGTKETFQIVLGDTLLPLLKPILGGITNLLNVVLKMMVKFPILGKLVMFTAVGFSVMLMVGGKLLMTLGIMVGAVMGLGLAFGQLSLMAIELGFSFAALQAVLWPLFLIMVAIFAILGAALFAFAAVVAVVVAAWKFNLGGFRDWAVEWAEKIRIAWAALTDFWDDYEADQSLVEKLQGTGLYDLVKGIIMLKWRFGQLLKGFKRSGAWVVLGAAISKVAKAIMWGVDAFSKLMVKMGLMSGQMGDGSDWQRFGDALAWIVVGASALALVIGGALAAAFGLLGVAILVAMTPVILFIGLVALLIWGIIEVVGWLGKMADKFGLLNQFGIPTGALGMIADAWGAGDAAQPAANQATGAGPVTASPVGTSASTSPAGAAASGGGTNSTQIGKVEMKLVQREGEDAQSFADRVALALEKLQENQMAEAV